MKSLFVLLVCIAPLALGLSEPLEDCDFCGPNTKCFLQEGIGALCSCIDGHEGDPYVGCQFVPECEENRDCPRDKFCRDAICEDLCQPDVCGPNAVCSMRNQTEFCHCLPGYQGNPLEFCQQTGFVEDICETEAHCGAQMICLGGNCVDPCQFDPPCGNNTKCEVVNHKAVCSCKDGFEGDPFEACTPVQGDQLCENSCGENTDCRVVNNRPVCSCKEGFVGNPVGVCQEDTCQNKPCGENADCSVRGDRAVCQCKPGFIGNPIEGCEPTSDHPCNENPCTENAFCFERNGRAVCACEEGYAGNPFSKCLPLEDTPCQPNPCGDNTECEDRGEVAVCRCQDGFRGDPYEGCTPQ